LLPLPADLVNAYINRFWGYGSPESRVWLIGPEEGGAASPNEIFSKMREWQESGQRRVRDLHPTRPRTKELDKWFVGPRPPIQTTWGKLIHFLLAVEGRNETNGREEIRAYQRDRLGRPSGGHCMLELLPLPAKGIGSWPYDKWTDLPLLRRRKKYEAEMIPSRVLELQGLLADYKPAIVLFYASGDLQLQRWREVAGTQLDPCDVCGRSVWFGRTAGTLFGVVPHPNRRGVTNRLFIEVGHRMAGSGRL